MSIELRCESCGKMLRASRESYGKRSKCPACGNEVYIRTPPTELDELPLAPEDEAERLRAEALQAERRQLDRAIAHEAPRTEDGGAAARGSRGTPTADAPNVREMVVDYLLALRGSQLSKADDLLASLLHHRAAARDEVERLTNDQIPPGQLADVPRAVLQGFLKNLRSQL